MDMRLGESQNRCGRRWEKKFLTLPGLELRTLRRPARSQSLYWLRYPCSFVIPCDLEKAKGFGGRYRFLLQNSRIIWAINQLDQVTLLRRTVYSSELLPWELQIRKSFTNFTRLHYLHAQPIVASLEFTVLGMADDTSHNTLVVLYCLYWIAHQIYFSLLQILSIELRNCVVLYMRFEVSTGAKTQVMIFWAVALCNMLRGCQVSSGCWKLRNNLTYCDPQDYSLYWICILECHGT
jgi:hypothetical protein